MTREGRKYIIKVLFTISFAFLSTGLYIEINNRLNYSDPRNTASSVEYDKVSITPADKNAFLGFANLPSGDEESIENNADDNTRGNTEKSDDLDDNTGDNTGGNTSENTSGNTGGSVTPTPTPEPEPTPTVTDLARTNNELRKSIESIYGILVSYGSETDGYTASGIMAVSLSTDTEINSALTQLNSALAKYPSGFFQEFFNNGYNSKLKLKILLIKKFTSSGNIGDITGLTAFGNPLVTISIAMDYPFNDSFYHEVYHYTEYFMQMNGASFVSWSDFNPTDFVYNGSMDASLSYSKTRNPAAYFVNNYAQTSVDEDRASTFEYMTASYKADCYNSREYPIWKKSNYMANMIDAYFSTVSPSITEYWERFLY